MIRTSSFQSCMFHRASQLAPVVAGTLLGIGAGWCASALPGVSMGWVIVAGIFGGLVGMAVIGGMIAVVLQASLRQPVEQPPKGMDEAAYAGGVLITRAALVDMARLWRRGDAWKTKIEHFLSTGTQDGFLHRDLFQISKWCDQAKIVSISRAVYQRHPRMAAWIRRLPRWESTILPAMLSTLGGFRAVQQAAALQAVTPPSSSQAPPRRRP